MGLANPASVNCSDQGGILTIEKRGDGGEFGVCTFVDNQQCEEWALFRGECPVGGLKVTGYVTDAARYCAITGGEYTVDEAASANAEQEQGTCALPDGQTCDVWAYYNGECPPVDDGSSSAPADTTAAASTNPFDYCASVGTEDQPAIETEDGKLPPEIIQGMVDQNVISADAPDAILQGAFWRCMDGNVYVCVVGANLPCTEQADMSDTPTPEMNNFCSDNANSDFIPASVTGRATVYSWKCDGTDAVVDQQVFTPDEQGYLSDFWTELTPPQQ